MELLSRLLLIAGLLMLTRNETAGLPRSQPMTTTHQAIPNTTPDPNNAEVFVQSIFDINPSCQPGWILVGSRCRKMA